MKEGYIPREALLPCGGRGLRMQSNSEEPVIKPLLKVADRELLRYSLDNLPPRMISKLIVATRSVGDAVHNWVQSSNLPYTDVIFSFLGDIPLMERINRTSALLESDDFALCNTDEIRKGLNLAEVVEFHRKSGGLATMVLGYSDHLNEQRVVTIDKNGRVTHTTKNPEEYMGAPDMKGLVNTGFILMHKRALESAVASPEGGWSCFLDPLSDAGQLFAFVDPKITYFNINTSSQLKKANDYFAQDT